MGCLRSPNFKQKGEVTTVNNNMEGIAQVVEHVKGDLKKPHAAILHIPC